MTEGRRILINVLAAYGKSLVALACGIFTGRWILLALGESDYGLYGVVGGLTLFIGFFNVLLASAVARFYAVAVGEGVRDPDGGAARCRAWFNAALLIHTAVPILLMAVGYPIADWAVRHWINIPADRVHACLCVLRCLCVSCFLGMVCTPFRAMFIARQRLVELSVYDFLLTVANFLFALWMIGAPAPADGWLAPYALWMMLLRSIPELLVMGRAMALFPACRFRRALLWAPERLRAICSFAGWNLLTSAGELLRTQGIAILITRAFGAPVNAAMTLANTVGFHCNNLSNSLVIAFNPAIANARGANDLSAMRALAFRTAKLAPLLTLLFLLPLTLELPYVLRLWLRDVPAFTAVFACYVFAYTLILRLTAGHLAAIEANGVVAPYQRVAGTAIILSLPLAWVLTKAGLGPHGIGLAFVISATGCAAGRVWFARRLAGMGARRWLGGILLPLGGLSLLSAAIGVLPQLFLAPSFLRLCLTTALTELTFLPLAYLLLSPAERAFLRAQLAALRRRLA